MHRSTISFFKYAALAIGFAIACGPQPIDVPEDDDDDDRGGTGTGASPGFGGSSSGATFTGGTPATGGFSGTAPSGGFGGNVATGGFSGTPMTGGSFPGGSPGSGGVAGTFPQGGTGIAGSAAGTPSTSGAGGGATVSCGAAFIADPDGFVRAPASASGCWHGYAYAGGDVGSMVMPTTFAMCGASCMLRTSGMLGPANAANSYAGVAYIGFNVNQTAGASTMQTLVPAGTSLVVTYTKVAGPATIRVQIQAGSSRWCANLTASPASIPYAMFNTMCWEPTNAMAMAYAKQPIDAVQLVAPGGETAVALDMTLVSVKDM